MAEWMVKAKANVDHGEGCFVVSKEFRKLPPITQADILKDIMQDAIVQYNLSIDALHTQLSKNVKKQ